MNEATQTRTTMIGGALFAFIANITSSDIIKTIVLTAIGAIMSFVMSLLLKALQKWWKTRRG